MEPPKNLNQQNGLLRVMIRCLVVFFLLIALGFLGNLGYSIYINVQPLPPFPNKEKLSMGYKYRTNMMRGDEYVDDFRYEFLRNGLEMRVDLPESVIDDKEHTHIYDVIITNRIGKKLYQSRVVIEKGSTNRFSGFTKPIPAENWRDGEYMIHIYRDHTLVAKRTFELVRYMPWWQKIFIWYDPLRTELRKLLYK